MLLTSSKIKRTQQGVGLIEVMIAVLVLGVGLLGILTLQKTALQYNQGSFYHSQASIMLNDITEKIRANFDSAQSYRLAFGSTPNVDADKCINQACTPDELADWDVALWKNRIEAIFPGGDAEITIAPINSQAPSTATVQFSLEGAPNNPQTISVEFRI